MNNHELFTIWAPELAPWSPWVKPVLFALPETPRALAPGPVLPLVTDWCPPAGGEVALVLDLPGAEGVNAGIALAARGYRPIPLYNAVPLPLGLPDTTIPGEQPVAAVDVLPIVRALWAGAGRLAGLNLPGNAPPAFLLDANRSGTGRPMEPDDFDNRSISFTTDFPSANFLVFHGVQQVILVQKDWLEPQSDLAHSLRRWQDAGIVLKRKRLDSPGRPERFEVAKPSWYGAMFQRALSSLGLQRAGTGGFGAWIPESPASG